VVENHSPAVVAIVATTIAEIDFSSISTIVAVVAIIWKPLSRDCSDRCDEKNTRMQYVAVCSRSSWDFVHSVAIVGRALSRVFEG